MDVKEQDAPESVKRKLTTILAAGVEGYSRLMRDDEEATVRTLGRYREIIDGLIARHDGRVFNTAGDAVMAEFASPVEAVRCAIAFQEEVARCNGEVPEGRRLRFRIGVNVGDVVISGGDLLGDGVNVAARLEGLAESGGVCVSASVFEQVKHNISLGFEDMGPQKVKNIADPVSVYRLMLDPASASASRTTARPARAPRKRPVKTVVFLMLFAGGITWWHAAVPAGNLSGLERVCAVLGSLSGPDFAPGGRITLAERARLHDSWRAPSWARQPISRLRAAVCR